jgi:ribosomal protein S12 methylthiotransferase RimO
MKNQKKLHLVSLGCTKNLIDSEVMLGKLKDYEIVENSSCADVIIVNTCGFIQSAKEESLETIFELYETKKDDAIIVMAGCLSQRYKDELQQELKDEVDIFLGVGDYDIIDKLIQEKRSSFSNKVFLADEQYDRVVTGSNYHAYIKLSEGCNQQCSFCAIPSFKGKLQSRTIESIITEVKKMIKQGFFDFSFVSQDSSSYLRDFGINDGLEQLIDAVEQLDGIKSARILYLYPSTTTFDLIDKISNSKIFHTYYDIPLQHISQSLLKTMKRGKGSEQIKQMITYMRSKPNSFVRTTFIVGHPKETQEDFDKLCDYIQEANFDRINIFAYSNEEDTYAYTLKEQVPDDIIDQRATTIGDIVNNLTQQKLQEDIGKIYDVVIDGTSSEHEYLLSARRLLWAPQVDAEIYINDNQTSQTLQVGKIYKAKITQVVGDKLLGCII